MSFNNFLTPVWCDAGAPVNWWYTFYDNQGAQYAMANCLSPDGQMITNYQGCQLNDDSTVTYFVGFTNNGPEPCFHNLNGGGLS
jgi:hypothetical protein